MFIVRPTQDPRLMSLSRTSVALVGLSVSMLIAPNLRAADSGADASTTTTPPADADAGVAEVVVTARRLNSARSEIQTQTGASTYTISNEAIAAAPGGENVGMNQVLLQAPDVVQ